MILGVVLQLTIGVCVPRQTPPQDGEPQKQLKNKSWAPISTPALLADSVYSHIKAPWSLLVAGEETVWALHK